MARHQCHSASPFPPFFYFFFFSDLIIIIPLFAMLSRCLCGYAPLQFLLFLTLGQLISARIPIAPLTEQSFLSSFVTNDRTQKGGCDRNAPNGVPMWNYTLGSLGGAWAIAQTVSRDLPNYPTNTYIRGLLFLFFGITFEASHQLNPDQDNVNAFNNIIGMV